MRSADRRPDYWRHDDAAIDENGHRSTDVPFPSRAAFAPRRLPGTARQLQTGQNHGPPPDSGRCCRCVRRSRDASKLPMRISGLRNNRLLEPVVLLPSAPRTERPRESASFRRSTADSKAIAALLMIHQRSSKVRATRLIWWKHSSSPGSTSPVPMLVGDSDDSRDASSSPVHAIFPRSPRLFR